MTSPDMYMYMYTLNENILIASVEQGWSSRKYLSLNFLLK